MPKAQARSSPNYLTHRRWSVEDAQEALAAQERSGLTLRAFAAREGLSAQRLDRWRRRLAAERVATFVEVSPSQSKAVSPGEGWVVGPRERFEIVLRSGRVVRVAESFDASARGRLLAVVDAVQAC